MEESLKEILSYTVCTQELEEYRPELFPKDLWRWVADEQKPRVKRILERYPKERWELMVETILEKVRICTKGEQRKEEEQVFRALLLANSDVFFQVDEENPERIKGIETKIEVFDETPRVCSYQQRFSWLEQWFLHWKMKELKSKKIVKESTSPWRHGLLLVPYPERIREYLVKYGDQAQENIAAGIDKEKILRFYRTTVDLRPLNDVTVRTHYPLPYPEDVIAEARGCTHFSSLDQADSFWAIALHPDSWKYTAFATHEEMLEFTVLPMGWTNAAQTFQNVARETMKQIPRKYGNAFVDDMFVHNDSARLHWSVLQKVFDLAREKGVKFKPEKALINFPSIKVLGQIVDGEGRMPDPEKVRAIVDLKEPETLVEVQQQLGMIQYQREFVPRLYDNLAPLQELLAKGLNIKGVWRDDYHGIAFNNLKMALIREPILYLYNPSKRCMIEVDSCTHK